MADPDRSWVCIDGNEAAADVAYRLSEIAAVYPITPASSMGELADAWSTAGRRNLWGSVPEVVEMQSEAGAAGAVHGALLRGALATTFTASQGLLLMLPNMFKIAGELTPTVFHVAARAVATHALSIFGDHSDVMAVRAGGFAMLASSSVQEAHDLALVAHASTLASRVPFLHFFDGFRTSHEIARIEMLTDEDLAALVEIEDVLAHRGRGLSPEHPLLRGSAQNPDVFFQAREAANPFYMDVPRIVQERMDRLAVRTGRAYRLVDYAGAPDAERVIVLMGSAAGAATEAVDALMRNGERVGVVTVRLYRPFPAEALVSSLPSTTRALAVLDRCKEPGSVGEPLWQDVVTSLAETAWGSERREPSPVTIGGRYGLASKEFTPAMAKAVFDELDRATEDARARRHFTVGITDDVTRTSLNVDRAFSTEDPETFQAVFYGLGSDGTVGANKNSAKIIGEETGLRVQGYFVYDSKKSGSVTVSHLRFGPRPIRSTYLIERADFVACHQFGLLDRMDVLRHARAGATLLLNSPFGPDDAWDRLPREVQQQILDKGLRLFVIDANRVARDAGMGFRINTVMQPCFFALSGLLSERDAVAAIKRSIERTYGKRGRSVVERNNAAVDRALEALHEVTVPSEVTSQTHRRPAISGPAPEFVERVTARMLAGEGDLLPVSALPVDGTFPTGTARWEKRTIAQEIPIWDPSICIDCGKCAIVCPHAAIRMKVFDQSTIQPGAGDESQDRPSPGGPPSGFQTKEFKWRDHPGMRLAIQVAPDDCTGCGVCVTVCPAHSKEEIKHKSINMEPIGEHLEAERENFDYFLGIPELDRTLMAADSVKGSQVREPLFEFSGACAGCGETPYLKLLTQLFGDRIVVANATGCSSIFGGNLPTTPWSTGTDGRGPAWANSLFEDNAEFGFGVRLAMDHHASQARQLLQRCAPAVGEDLVRQILEAEQSDDAGVIAQRGRLAELRSRLEGLGGTGGDDATSLLGLADHLVRQSVWIVGGDGWAYDIGSGGLDHVLASGRDVNVLVLDTEVYSNTGGQASKATPRGASAKFASRGKTTAKKDLGLIAMSYGNVYVAQVALGANDMQTVRVFLEAEAWPGPSLVIAYSTCIAHGIDMAESMTRQREAVHAGYWPLFRYRPGDEHPLHLDSGKPSIPLRQFAEGEARFAMVARRSPAEFDHLMRLAQEDVNDRWQLYEQLAGVGRVAPRLPESPAEDRAAPFAAEEEG